MYRPAPNFAATVAFDLVPMRVAQNFSFAQTRRFSNLVQKVCSCLFEKGGREAGVYGTNACLRQWWRSTWFPCAWRRQSHLPLQRVTCFPLDLTKRLSFRS